MGGCIIFGSHNKQLAPFSLFEVEGGGSSESDALLWLLSYG